MGRFTLCLAALALFTVSAFGAEHVVTLTADNFSEIVKANDKLIVEFYAPWCGHCKKLTPEYEAAAEKLKADGIVLAKMDATEEGAKKVSAKFGVKGFPTLKIFRGDEASPEEYQGPRETAGIVSYAKKVFGPASAELTSADAIKAATSAPEDVTVLGVFPDADSAEFKLWLKLAGDLRDDATFLHTFKAADTADCKDCKTPSAILYKDFDEPMVKFDGAFDEAALTKFINSKSSPALVSLDRSNKNKKALQKMFADQKPKLLGMMSMDHADLAAFKTKLTTLSADEQDVHVLFVDPAENAGALDFFGLKVEDTPAITIHSPEKNSKFTIRNVALDKIDSWLSDYKEGKLKKEVKSEQPPATNDEPVKVVVSSQFDEIVFSGKDVMIEFYAPWCGHCKTLAPVYDELALKLKDKTHIVLAKMDATANDVPGDQFDVKGFPTLYFVSGKDQKVHAYSGGRDLASLEEFILKTANSAEDTKDEL